MQAVVAFDWREAYVVIWNRLALRAKLSFYPLALDRCDAIRVAGVRASSTPRYRIWYRRRLRVMPWSHRSSTVRAPVACLWRPGTDGRLSDSMF